ncbi:MAG: glycosyltransferase family 2 protein [Alistipes sp.]|nr:glycosyltransferase family 2 protein [Alistipes sp.]
MAPADLETYLRSHYGDIQKWLPEEKRLNHAPEVLHFGESVTTAESESISVVIPLYNKELEVERALRSVLSQSLMPGEIIVVDDGSTDGSRAVVERVMAENPTSNIRLLVQKNGGVSAARNRGIAEAKGRYVALLDADDWWLTGYIAEVCRMMEYYPDAEAYSTAFDIVSGDKRVRAAVPECEGVINPAEEALRSRYPIIPSTATLLRSAVMECGGFPEGMRIGEDQWLWVRMMQRGCRFVFSPMSLVRYSREASNRSAAIYRAEQSQHSLEGLYSSEQDEQLNEYIARIALGKAITQSVRGGTEDARRAAEKFSYTHLSRRQLYRLRMLNTLPVALRPLVDRLYSTLAWVVRRRGL